MNKTRKQRYAFIITSIGFCFFWMLNSELWQAQCLASQSIFHTYSQPVPVPDFSLENLQGNTVNIKEHRGQVILINFWATW